MAILKYGSIGDEVKKLQNLLNASGNYGLAEDGKFGNKTLAAVKDYQKKNNLAVDGMVGTNTWGALNKVNTATTTPTTTPTAQPSPTYKYEEFKYDPYEKSDVIKQAEALIQEKMANQPGELQYAWQDQLDDIYNKIMNREEFSYDLNGDALYQQYKDQYTTQGKMAMMDTMGQAAALTGGYGSSYAQSVGQQTYQGYLQQLNDKVPELYQLALNQYNQEEQGLYNQAALLAQDKEQQIGLHRDKVDNYWKDLNYLTGRLDTLSKNEYDAYMDKVGMDYDIHTDTQEAGYQAQKDAYDKAMSMLGIGVTPDSSVLSTAGISSVEAQAIVQKVKEQEAAAKASSGGTEDKGNTGNTNKGYDNGTYSSDIVKQAQKFVGASQDGKWGSNSTAAAKAKGYNSLAEVVAAMGNNGGGLNASDYAGWDAVKWNDYFAVIRKDEGKAAAEKELEEFTRQGIIPKKYLSAASTGARGSMGH